MKITINWSTNQLFSYAPDTNLKKIIEEALELLNFNPEILTNIKNDQDALSFKRKKIRLEDKRYYADKTLSLIPSSKIIETKQINEKELILQTGRPRMTSIVVYIFLMIRGVFSSVTDKEATERLIDSYTLNHALQSLDTKMPGFTTILENLNAVTNKTRQIILDAQIKKILNDELDDFEKCQIDSTAIKANSEWPTDSRMSLKFLQRSHHYLQKLEEFGLPKLKLWYSTKWIAKLKELNFSINNVAGKPDSAKKIKRYYRQFLNNAQKLHDYLIKEKERLEENYVDLAPSVRGKLEIVWRMIDNDLQDVAQILYYTENRIFHGIVLKSSEKILSISDRTAAYIQKGNRIPLIGYKPQIARSGNGFVTSLIVPEGNASDSKQFIPVLEDSVNRTTVIPAVLSVDDGYSSAKGRKLALNMGIKTVSIGGAKGKKLTPEIDWNSEEYKQARADRSAVESTIFTLKYIFDFGVLRRREIEQVRAELLEKVIVFNFYKIITVKEKLRIKKKECYDKLLA